MPTASGPVAASRELSFGSFHSAHGEPRSTGRGYAFGAAAQLRRPSGLRYALELTAHVADYVTPAGLTCGASCSFDREMSLTVWGIGVGIAQELRLGAADLYAGAGVGLYLSNLNAGQVVFGVPADGIDERDSGLGLDFRFGVLFDLGESGGLGVEYRRLSLRANFGMLSNGTSMEVSGDFFRGIYRKAF